MIRLLAATAYPSIIGAPVWPTPNPKFTDIRTISAEVLTLIFGFAGVFAVLAIVYSGFMYITSGGDSDQAGKAKKNLTFAIIGAVIVASASTIVWWVNNILTTAPH